MHMTAGIKLLDVFPVVHFDDAACTSLSIFRRMQLLSKNEALEKEQCTVHTGCCASHGQGEQCRMGTQHSFIVKEAI